MTVAAPILGLTNKAEQENYLKELEHCMATTSGYYNVNVVVAQKLA